ncbi:MAG: glycosyltransferase [Phycisphaeraceae bacterium]
MNATAIPTPALSVVVPCKGAGTLGACLDSLSPQHQSFDRPYEVVVVDGWWDDEVAAMCEPLPWVRLVRSKDNLVPGPARNLGVEHASTGLIVFLDADCVASSTYLASAHHALTNGARISGGPIMDALRSPVAKADNFVQFADFPPGREDGAVAWLPTCNFAVHKEDFLAVGGFVDTGMPLGEDPILCFEIGRRTPGGVRFTADQRVRHRGRAELRAMLGHHWKFGYGRAVLGIEVKPWQRSVGRSIFSVPAVAMWRYLYLMRRTAKWAPVRLFRALLLTPITLLALFAWAWGFRAGCHQPIQDVGSDALAPLADQVR